MEAPRRFPRCPRDRLDDEGTETKWGHMARIAVPLMLGVPGGPVLSLISTTTVFGTANDITLAELTLESFFPADASTRDFFLAHG